jgi:iron(III) transport system ATP-binding protein
VKFCPALYTRGVWKLKSVKLENVSKLFRTKKGVENININIAPGEFFTLLGPSGCGKTTTLRMIAGFYFPTEGRIYFDNEDVTYVNPDKRNIGMVFQNYALFPHMTVFENIAFGLEVRKVPKSVIKEKVIRAQKLVHLDGYGDRKITELSGGQQQRVALARALVIEPSILLLDEPLSNLDAKLREETRLEIKRLQVELGVTTIYVTHDQSEAMAMSDRIMVMKDGKVQQIGTPQDIYNRPVNHFVASFIGESNILNGEILDIEGEYVVIKIEDGTIVKGKTNNISPKAKLTKRSYVNLSIRPEAILVEDGPNSLNGTVEFVEFTGVSINYIVKINNHILKVMVINKGEKILERGDSISIHIPPQSVYIIGE